MLREIGNLKSEMAIVREENRQLTRAVGDLEVGNRRLFEHVRKYEIDFGRPFYWQVPDFDKRTLERYESPDFEAFGHVFYLSFVRQRDCSSQGLYLYMRSRVPDRIGFKFTVGRYEAAGREEHFDTYTSPGLCDFPAAGQWGWGYAEFQSSDLTRSKLLTPDGTLQFEVVVYKTMSS